MSLSKREVGYIPINKLEKIMDIITVEDNNEEIVIRHPKGLLMFSQSHREDPILVTDRDKMTNDFIESFLGYDNRVGGDGKFYELLDEWFLSRLESGEDYLKGWWEDNET